MSTFPVRRLGATGIVTDAHPADIPSIGTFTGGVNVRFKNGRACRGPVARTIAALPHEPGHLLSIPPGSTGYDEVISIREDFGDFQRLNGSTWEDLTPASWAGAEGTQAITSCFLGGLSYVNRETHTPVYKAPGDSTYSTLPALPDDVRFRSLRSYKDQLVGLGVTKGGAFYPTMVKWSDLTGFGAPPGSWDTADTTNSAGENIINGMRQPLVDALGLHDSLVLYGTSEVWLMDYIGGDFIYSWRKLFDEVGVINQNCVVQVGGLHYVFDRSDIYVHDGVAPRSIADGRVKEFIFDALDFSRSNLCFVQHDAKLTEVRLCYPSGDGMVGFPNPTTGCNRQAVYNYSNDTWTFYDVPNVVGSAKAALVSSNDWDTDPDVTFDAAGGLWMSTEGDEDRQCLLASRSDPDHGISTPRLLGFDLITGGRLTQPVEPELVRPAQVVRIGIDLDDQGKNLTQYMNLQAVYPQMSCGDPDQCYWQFGATDQINREPDWGPMFRYDPEAEYKIDINEAGKYLGYRFYCGGTADFQLSGFDVTLIVRGRR